MQMKISATINRLVDKPDSNIKAFASVSFDGFYAVHGIKVCEGEKGRFVSMPSTQYTDRDGNKQYQDIFHPISKGARNALKQAVLNAYDIKLQQVQRPRSRWRILPMRRCPMIFPMNLNRKYQCSTKAGCANCHKGRTSAKGLDLQEKM